MEKKNHVAGRQWREAQELFQQVRDMAWQGAEKTRRPDLARVAGCATSQVRFPDWAGVNLLKLGKIHPRLIEEIQCTR